MKRLIPLIMALVMVFCLAVPAMAADEGPESFTVGTGNVLGTFLPWSENETTHGGCSLVYDYLFYWDENGDLYSDILDDWYYEEDGSTFVMVGKPGVIFNNGDEMTGDDIMFSIQNLVDRGTNAAGFYPTVDWENSYTDGLTVYLANTQEFGPGIANMGVVYLLNKAWTEEHGYDDITPWITDPCGSGPYKVVDYVTDSHITMELRDDYWGDYTGGAKTVTINHYSDTSAMYMALEGGEIDMALNIAESDYSRAVDDPSIEVVTTHEGDVIMLAMDQTNNEYLADENVRLAIAYGVDWEQVAASARGELAEVATSIVTEVSSYYNDCGAYQYDFEKAKEYMEASGYVVDGSTVNFSLYMHTVDQPVKTNAATVIQYYLQQLGIDFQTNFTDFPTAIGAWLTPGGTDLAFQDTDIGSVCGEPYFMLNAYSSELGMLPACIIPDEHWNELFNAGTYTTDEAERAANYTELQEYTHEHAFLIPIYESIDAVAYNPDVVAECGLHSAVGANLRLITFA